MRTRYTFISFCCLLLLSCSNNQSSTPRASTDTVFLKNQIEQLTQENKRLKVYADSLIQENAKKDQIITEIKQFFN